MPLAGGPAAIDGEAGAGDEGGCGRSKEDDGAGDLVHAPDPAERNSANDPIAKFRLGKERSSHGRFEERGRDGVHANVFRGEFDSHGFGQPFDRVLGHAVDRAPLGTDASHLR